MSDVRENEAFAAIVKRFVADLRASGFKADYLPRYVVQEVNNHTDLDPDGEGNFAIIAAWVPKVNVSINPSIPAGLALMGRDSNGQPVYLQVEPQERKDGE